jgi:hypothetical protein
MERGKLAAASCAADSACAAVVANDFPYMQQLLMCARSKRAGSQPGCCEQRCDALFD